MWNNNQDNPGRHMSPLHFDETEHRCEIDSFSYKQSRTGRARLYIIYFKSSSCLSHKAVGDTFPRERSGQDECSGRWVTRYTHLRSVRGRLSRVNDARYVACECCFFPTKPSTNDRPTDCSRARSPFTRSMQTIARQTRENTNRTLPSNIYIYIEQMLLQQD